MCVMAWGLIATIFVFCIPVGMAYQAMKRETKLAMHIIDRRDAIIARAMNQRGLADEARLEARKMRDQWKFAKIRSDAERTGISEK